MLSDSLSPTFQTECSKCHFRVEDHFRPPELTAMSSGVHLFHFASVVLVVDSKHATRLVCASRSSYSPPSNFVSGHVSTICASWSVAGHNHKKVIGQDPVCTDLHLASVHLIVAWCCHCEKFWVDKSDEIKHGSYRLSG